MHALPPFLSHTHLHAYIHPKQIREAILSSLYLSGVLARTHACEREIKQKLAYAHARRSERERAYARAREEERARKREREREGGG